MEQIRIPQAWLVFFLGYNVEVIRPIVEYLGDDGGSFPGWSDLVMSFLVHTEHKISFLKCSASDISGMEPTQVLLTNGRLDHSHLSFFL